jgi:hypothetical protein
LLTVDIARIGVRLFRALLGVFDRLPFRLRLFIVLILRLRLRLRRGSRRLIRRQGLRAGNACGKNQS